MIAVSHARLDTKSTERTDLTDENDRRSPAEYVHDHADVANHAFHQTILGVFPWAPHTCPINYCQTVPPFDAETVDENLEAKPGQIGKLVEAVIKQSPSKHPLAGHAVQAHKLPDDERVLSEADCDVSGVVQDRQ